MKKNKKPLLELKNISYTLKNDSDESKKILKDISFSVCENDFIGIIGKSGAGKTTLLKIISGLIKQTKGRLVNFSKPPKITVVFEDASLFPWLNVRENVQLGLRASYLPEKEENTKVDEVIDLIGLSEYSESYPKELSAGMKQRVNFARALVSEPDILLMDDPFISLDILTSESLKNDLFDFLSQDIIQIKAMLMVTHNIHDIMKLCSSVLVFKNTPTELQSSIDIDLPFPRNEDSNEYHKILDQIYNEIEEESYYNKNHKKVSIYKSYLEFIGTPPSAVLSLIDILMKRYKGESDSNTLIKELNIDEKEFYSILKFANELNVVKHHDGSIRITAFGRTITEASSIETQQILFGKQLLKEFPIIKLLSFGEIKSTRKLKSTLSKSLTQTQTSKVASALISWAKFGKLIK